MKRLLLIVGCIVFLSAHSAAQLGVSMGYSNYAGVSQLGFTPAIADNNRLFEVNVFSAGLRNASDILTVNSNWKKINLFGFKDRYTPPDLGLSGKNYLFESYDVQMPFSFIATIGDKWKNKMAVGFSWNVHSLFSARNINSTTADMLIFNHAEKGVSGNHFSDQKASINAMTWMDYDLTFSGVVFEKQKHFLKAGITGKYLKGIDALHFYSSSINYQWTDEDHLKIKTASGEYFRSAAYSFERDYIPVPSRNPGKGWGMDIGLIYEFRPDSARYHYLMDGSVYTDHRKSKHLFSVGFSLMNVGKITMPAAPSARSFSGSEFVLSKEQLTGLTSTLDLDSLVIQQMHSKKNAAEFAMHLPTAFHSFMDIEIYKGAGVHLSYIHSLYFKQPEAFAVYRPSAFYLTPKYENEKIGIYLPWCHDAFGQNNLGASFRFGSVFLGTGSIGNLLKSFGKGAETADVFFGIKIPIRQKTLIDTDNDKVSDPNDRCPQQPGLLIAMGCPDADADSIPDDIDACPQIPGLRKFNGCPDTDGDGIIDSEDKCPLWAGPPEYNGCPDRDDDGVWDFEDECPDLPGKPEAQGCPDSDGDGVYDHLDQCPDLPGKPEWDGCPDSDGDEIPDHKDDCPNEAGPKENGGCRYTDIDEDGVLDKDDLCPLVYGPASNKGCPVKVKYSNLKIYDIVYFENGVVFNVENQKRLDNLAFDLNFILLKNPHYKVLLEGYAELADGIRDRIKLSQERADTIKNYLISKGIPKDHITTGANGDKFPHNSISPPEGKYPNRRVEIFIDLGDVIDKEKATEN